MTFSEPPADRAQRFAVDRFYKRLRIGYFGLFAVILLGPVLYLVGGPFYVGVLMVAAVIGAFFLGISFGRMIETVGRRAGLKEESGRHQDMLGERRERLHRPSRFDEEEGF